MLTIVEVAKELKVNEITIYRKLIKGNIKGIKVGKQWRISEKELEKIKEKGC